MLNLTEEQEKILLEIINNYKKYDYTNLEPPKNEQTSLRSIAIYKSQFAEFASFCKAHQISQAEAIYKAVQIFMNTYKK